MPYKIRKFKKDVLGFYIVHKRNFAWRKNINPYRILVSEIMLQQTQVSRVSIKFNQFLKVFPNFKALALAPQAEVLACWSGLGYNRRAMNLKRTAEIVVHTYNGRLPAEREKLIALPGIGINTAGAILAYAFNVPTPFIETNIRRVFIHHFFPNQGNIRDKDILALVEKTIDSENPREWYWALMDYGSYLAKTIKNPNLRSKHYTKQSKFEGSARQIRGAILKSLIIKKMTALLLVKHTGAQKEILREIINDLIREGFIIKKKSTYSLR